MESSNVFAHPFVKWVGGKKQLLPEISKRYPSSFTKYCEPFVGGGAVLFNVLSLFNPEQVLINDLNPELIHTYRCIKDSPKDLINRLFELEHQYYGANDKKEFYLTRRDEFNRLIIERASTVEKAALFIMLNKTCFNGLYRVNSKSLFNVPFNGSVRPTICDSENILRCSSLLQKTIIMQGSYLDVYDFIDKDTFVYFDPPYRPLTISSAFTSYNEKGFTDDDQIQLSNFVKSISEKGARFLLSNSDPKNIDKNDNFFDYIYRDFSIERVKANRMINSKGNSRGAIDELLINNYIF